MQISIQSDLKRFEKDLTDIEKKQIPFATSLALNNTAIEAQKEAQRQMGRRLDRPTPFTKRGVNVKRSSKYKLQASIFIQDIQAEYLKYAIEGGTRRPKGKAIPIPQGIRLNQFGNMPRNKIKQLLARDDVFVINNDDSAGIYQRMRNGTFKLLASFHSEAKYKARYPFEDIVRKEVGKRFRAFMKQSLDKALATAKGTP